MKLAVVSSAMATMRAALLVLGPVLVGCSRNGHDTATYADGSTYAGDWRDAVRHGKGIMKYVDGRYTGEWKDDQRRSQHQKRSVGELLRLVSAKQLNHILRL